MSKAAASTRGRLTSTIRAERTKRGRQTVPVAKCKPRTAKPAPPAFTPYIPPTEPTTYPQGQWPLLKLKTHGQCHFPTERSIKGGTLFCGEPAPIRPGNPHGSWCEHHRSVVFGEGTVSERDAGRMGREVQS